MIEPCLVRGLYAIADTACLGERLVSAVNAAIAGGARTVQYRDKTGDRVRRISEAQALARLCADRGVRFLVNDDVELAVAVAADGVHLGRDDPAPSQARARLGDAAIIGASCYNELERARAALVAGADYVAFGSFFPSNTKPDAARADVALLRAARAQVSLPIVAIGGITPENGAELIKAGADALAVATGLFTAFDIRGMARRFALLFPES